MPRVLEHFRSPRADRILSGGRGLPTLTGRAAHASSIWPQRRAFLDPQRNLAHRKIPAQPLPPRHHHASGAAQTNRFGGSSRRRRIHRRDFQGRRGRRDRLRIPDGDSRNGPSGGAAVARRLGAMGESLGRSEQSLETRANVVRRARIAVLLLLGSLALAALSAGPLMGRWPELGFSVKCLAMLATAAVIAFLQFRDLVVASAVAFGPLPGAAIAFCEATRQSMPYSLSLPIAFVYGLGFAVALLLGDRYASGF